MSLADKPTHAGRPRLTLPGRSAPATTPVLRAVPAVLELYRKTNQTRGHGTLVVVVTRTDGVDWHNYFDFENPSGELPLLPSDATVIENIAAGRAVLFRSPIGLALWGFPEGISPESVRAALARR